MLIRAGNFELYVPVWSADVLLLTAHATCNVYVAPPCMSADIEVLHTQLPKHLVSHGSSKKNPASMAFLLSLSRASWACH